VFAGFAIAQAFSVAQPRMVRIAGAVLAIACLAYTPIDVRRLDDLHDQVDVADSVYSDLRDQVEDCDFAGRVQVPDVRLRPQIAYWADVDPADVGTDSAGASVEPVGPVAKELSSRSLPSDPDVSAGTPPFWRLAGCARQ